MWCCVQSYDVICVFVTVLMSFVSDQGKILPRRTTNLTSKQQKKVQKLIKRARIASLLPFVIGKN